MAQEAIISNANPTVASAINGLRIFIKLYPPFSRLMTTEIIRKRWAVQPFFEVHVPAAAGGDSIAMQRQPCYRTSGARTPAGGFA
jgi:hypothetical protein